MANTTLRAYLNDLKALLEREALEEVIGHCRHIIQHFPKNIEAYRTLGSALLERGRRAEAADVFQRVLGAVPDDFTAHIGLGSAYEESNIGAAIWHLERALEQEPTHQALQDELSRMLTVRDGAAPESYNLTRGALARVYLKSQLYNQAIIELQGALQQNPERVDLAVLLARTLWMSSHPVEASEVALQLLRTYPDNVEANRIMAALWLAIGRPSDAEPFIARLEQLDPFLAWETLHPDGMPVPRDAFQLPRLQWDARTAAAMDSSLPDWVSSIGDVFEAQEESAGLGASGVGPIVSPWAEDAAEEVVEDYGRPDSLDVVPDWLNDVVEPEPEPPLVQPSSTVADAFADYTPDWLNDEEEPSAADPFAGMGGTTAVEDALDWLQAGSMPDAPSAMDALELPDMLPTAPPGGGTDKLPQIEDFGAFVTPTPPSASEPPVTDELASDFAPNAFSWLETGPLPSPGADRQPPAAPRGRLPGETGPLTMLQPPTGPLGSTPPLPPTTPTPPAEPELDADALAWLQTGSLPSPDSEAAPALDFSAFEADLAASTGAAEWLDAAETQTPGSSLETSAELLGDIEENPDVWASGADVSQSAVLAGPETTPDVDLRFDSGWLRDLDDLPQAVPPADAVPAEPDLSFDVAQLAADAGQALDIDIEGLGAEGGDWLSGLGAVSGEGPGDQAPALDLAAWTTSEPGTPAEPSLDLTPAAEIPGWLSELRQAGAPSDAAPSGPEAEVAPAETPGVPSAAEAEGSTAFGEEISLESLDLGWLRSEPTPDGATAETGPGLGPLGDLFFDEELEPAVGDVAEPADMAAMEPPAMPEAAPPNDEQDDTLAWMRQVGILQGQAPAQEQLSQEEVAPSALPIDEDLLASASEALAGPGELDELLGALPTAPAAEPAPAESGVTEADVLAFLRDPGAAAASDMYARMNEEEQAQANLPLEPPAPLTATPAPQTATTPAPSPIETSEPVLEDDFLAAFEVGVSSAPHGTVADTDDWLSTLGAAPQETPGDDWLAQISRRTPVAPMEEPPPVAPVADEQAAPAPAAPEEDIPLWQRPAVTASLAQAAATMDMFEAEEPLVTEDDIPAWMREAADELLVAPTDSTPIAAQDESSSRGLLGFTPQADAPSRPRMDTGVLEPDGVPEWLSALSTEADAAPEAEGFEAGASDAGTETLDAQPDWLASMEQTTSDTLATAPEPELWSEPAPSAAAQPAAPSMGSDWLDNVFAPDAGEPEATEADEFAAFGAGQDADTGLEQPIVGEMPAWMQDMGLKLPGGAGAATGAAGQATAGPAPTPLEDLDFSSLELGGEAQPEGAQIGAAEPFDFLSGLGTPPGEPVAKGADLADTTNKPGAAAPDMDKATRPEPPAEQETKGSARFSFNKEPAWKRRRQGSDGAP